MYLTVIDLPYAYELQILTGLFFPGCLLDTGNEIPADADRLILRREEGAVCALLSRDGEEYTTRWELDAGHTEKEECRQCCVALYRFLSPICGITPPWGVLTGVRPIRLVHDQLNAGMTPQQAAKVLGEEYLVSEQKLRLSLSTAVTQLPLLARSGRDSFSLYVSIPFCPSRCRYCSFVSHSIDKAKKLIEPYLERLHREISLIGEISAQLGLRLQTVYIGGGTPTTLTASQLSALCRHIAEVFDSFAPEEFTVEAGRPDTITPEKLSALREAGVTRISINPQTMNPAVLEAIGRRHSVDQTREAFRMAEQFDFPCVNADLIAGLPGDTPESFRASLEEVLSFHPENITVHTLSIKRASDFSGAEVIPGAAGKMLDFTQEALSAAGYLPYYLYRQKNTVENMENTGYSLPGYEGLYNLYMMDETHTVLSAGAGAVTMLRQPGGSRIERIFNYKFPYEYNSDFDEILRRKEQIREFYRRFPVSQ